MPEFVRVKHDVFGEYTISDAAVDTDIHTVLDKPAVDQNGDTLPGKPRTSVKTTAKKSTNGDEPAKTPEEGSA